VITFTAIRSEDNPAMICALLGLHLCFLPCIVILRSKDALLLRRGLLLILLLWRLHDVILSLSFISPSVPSRSRHTVEIVEFFKIVLCIRLDDFLVPLCS